MIKKILKIIGAIIGLLLLGFIILMFVVETAPSDQVVFDHIGLIKSGKIDEAWSISSKGFRETATKEQFQNMLDGFPVWRNHERATLGAHKFKNDLTIVSGLFYDKAGVETPFEMLYVREDGKWLIAGLRVSVEADKNTGAQKSESPGDNTPVISNIVIGTNFDEENNTIGREMTKFSPNAPDISLVGTVKNIHEKLHLTITLFYKTTSKPVIVKSLQISPAATYYNIYMNATIENAWPVGDYEYQLVFENEKNEKVLQAKYPLTVVK